MGVRGLDAARSALRLGAEEVSIFYQRKVVGRFDEIRRGEEEGVRFELLTKPLKLIGDKNRWVKQVQLLRLEFAPIGKKGRTRILRVKDQSFCTMRKPLLSRLKTHPIW